MTLHIAIADDHELILQGLSLMLEGVPGMTIVWKNAGGENLAANLITHRPDILLLDIQMPGYSGIDLCKELTKQLPDLRIIALTNFAEAYYVKQMMRNGARGYLLKNTDQDLLLRAITTVAAGEIFLDPAIQQVLLDQLTRTRSASSVTLTRRESEILKLIAEEHTNQQIADRLFISLRTVETHRLNLTQKLSVKSAAGLVKEAMKRGLI